MTDQDNSNQQNENKNDNQDAAVDPKNLHQAAIQRVYVKDISFEAPNLPDMFTVEYKPKVNLDMNSKSRQVADDNYEVILTISLKAEQDEKTVFLAEVQQAGVFLIKNVNQEQLQHALSVMGPETLYPYIRETIASLISKTGFPSIQIAPVNFQVLYLQKLQEAQAAAQTNGDQPESVNNESANGATIQ